MEIKTALFFIFSFIAILMSIYVILQKDPVKSVLGLVLVFFSTSLTWLLLQIDFIAVMLVLVYIGAVMVLFLFVVMMVQGYKPYLKSSFSITQFIFVLIPVCLVCLIYQTFNFVHQAITPFTIKELAIALYTEYPILIQQSSLILLVAMISSVCLAYQGPRNRLVQDREQQLNASKNQRLKIIKDLKP